LIRNSCFKRTGSATATGVGTGIEFTKPYEAKDGRIRAYRDVLVACFGNSSVVLTYFGRPILS